MYCYSCFLLLFFIFLNGFIFSKEIEELRDIIGKQSLSQMMISRQLRDTKTELHQWRAKATKLEYEIEMLNEEISSKDKFDSFNSSNEINDNLKKKQQISEGKKQRETIFIVDSVLNEDVRECIPLDLGDEKKENNICGNVKEPQASCLKSVTFSEDVVDAKITRRKGKVVTCKKILIPNKKT